MKKKEIATIAIALIASLAFYAITSNAIASALAAALLVILAMYRDWDKRF